jgi:hypothetical protein
MGLVRAQRCASPLPAVMVILLPSGAKNSATIGTPLFAAALEIRSISAWVNLARDILRIHVSAFSSS